MRTQNMAIRLSLYLGSQSICIMGFGFPTMGGPMLRDLSTLLFPQTLLFTSQSCYLSLFRVVALSSQFSLQGYQPPIPHSFLLFIGWDKWRCYDYSFLLVRMGVQFHHLKMDALSGKVEVALELIPTFRSPLSSNVLKGTTG